MLRAPMLWAKVPVSGQQRQCAHQFVRPQPYPQLHGYGRRGGRLLACAQMRKPSAHGGCCSDNARGVSWRVRPGNATTQALKCSAESAQSARHSCPSNVWADQRIKNLHANFRSSYRCCQLNSKATGPIISYCLARLSMASTLRSPVIGVSPPPSTPPRLGSFGFAPSFPPFFAPAGGRVGGGGMAALLALATAARVSLAPLPLSTMNGCAVFSCDCVAGDGWMHRAYVTVNDAQVGHYNNCGV